jgi:hypothetical protein
MGGGKGGSDRTHEEHTQRVNVEEGKRRFHSLVGSAVARRMENIGNV